MKSKLKTIALILCVVVMSTAALTFGACSSDSQTVGGEIAKPDLNKPDFNKIYESVESTLYCEVGEDGSYMTVDTNPFDWDDFSSSTGYSVLCDVVEKLGLPDSLIEEMNHTRAIDGRQTEVFKYVTVKWSYHPDKGLEATFKLNQ